MFKIIFCCDDKVKNALIFITPIYNVFSDLQKMISIQVTIDELTRQSALRLFLFPIDRNSTYEVLYLQTKSMDKVEKEGRHSCLFWAGVPLIGITILIPF